jgi:hypothetical protein
MPSSSRKVIPLFLTASESATTVKLEYGGHVSRKDDSFPARSLDDQETAVLVADSRGSAKGFFSDPGFGPGPFHVFTATHRQVPHRPEGFETFDWLVIGSTGDLSSTQVHAVSTWVRRGGNALVYRAPDANSELLGELLPTPPRETVTVRKGAEEDFRSLEDLPVALVKTGEGDGEVLATLGGVPLVRWIRLGAGNVIHLCADPTKPPFRDWEARGVFLGPIMQRARRMPTGGDPRIYNEELDLSGCEPGTLMIGLFLLLWAMVIGPGGFYLLRVLPPWRLGLLAFLLCAAVFGAAALFWGGTSMDSGPARSGFVILHGRGGSKSCLSERFESHMRCAPSHVRITGQGGELVAPLHTGIEEIDGRVRVDVGGTPCLASDDVAAGRPVLARRMEPSPVLPPTAEFEIREHWELYCRLENVTNLGLTDLTAVFGRNVYVESDFGPAESRGSSWDLQPDASADPHLRAVGLQPADAVDYHWGQVGAAPGHLRYASTPPLRRTPRGAWFDEKSGRIRFRGLLGARWTAAPGETVSGAGKGILYCLVETSNPSGRILIPPGILQPRWLREDLAPLPHTGQDVPRFEGRDVILPEESKALVEFALPVSGERLEWVRLSLGLAFPEESEESEVPPSGSLEITRYCWLPDVWDDGALDDVEAVHAADGRVRLMIDNASSSCVRILGAELCVEGRFRP